MFSKQGFFFKSQAALQTACMEQPWFGWRNLTKAMISHGAHDCFKTIVVVTEKDRQLVYFFMFALLHAFAFSIDKGMFNEYVDKQRSKNAIFVHFQGQKCPRVGRWAKLSPRSHSFTHYHTILLEPYKSQIHQNTEIVKNVLDIKIFRTRWILICAITNFTVTESLVMLGVW